MAVREDDVVRSDGSTGIFGVVEKPDFALVIPFDGAGFYMVEQYRYPVGARFVEFPQGSYEESAGVDPSSSRAGSSPKRRVYAQAASSTSVICSRRTATRTRASTSFSRPRAR